MSNTVTLAFAVTTEKTVDHNGPVEDLVNLIREQLEGGIMTFDDLFDWSEEVVIHITPVIIK